MRVVSEKNYLANLAAWSESLARQLANEEDIRLTPEHIEILYIARSFYAEYGFSPSMRPLLKYIATHLDISKGRSIYMMQLFPPSPARVAAKIAGLPKPKDCL
ncbi:MAG: TusE/DsrC/DsvC family sulfur relay protein [Pseudomonadales bacterium]|nr:TusE/DsrC/DsvC family sulfur relay protein [Pseudomonadales bacterium]